MGDQIRRPYYDALTEPIYGLRQPDGLTFNVFADTPIPNGDSKKMMQANNGSVEAQSYGSVVLNSQALETGRKRRGRLNPNEAAPLRGWAQTWIAARKQQLAHRPVP